MTKVISKARAEILATMRQLGCEATPAAICCVLKPAKETRVRYLLRKMVADGQLEQPFWSIYRLPNEKP